MRFFFKNHYPCFFLAMILEMLRLPPNCLRIRGKKPHQAAKQPLFFNCYYGRFGFFGILNYHFNTLRPLRLNQRLGVFLGRVSRGQLYVGEASFPRIKWDEYGKDAVTVKAKEGHKRKGDDIFFRALTVRGQLFIFSHLGVYFSR